MPRQNPYQMDPLLAQGFSNLTKALIGDPETDYQVARTGPPVQAERAAAATANTFIGLSWYSQLVQ